MKSKVILDVDTGIDDALALAYAIKSAQLDVIGITNCFGNIPLPTAVRNTQFVLDKLGVEIPIYPGSSHPLQREEFRVATHVHGEDGLGNVIGELAEEFPVKNVAIPYILDMLTESPDEITLIFVGPLTNLAKLIEKDITTVNKAKKIVIMGGAVTVPGNVNEHAEANIYSDAEAAKYVFESDVEVTLVGLDVTMQTLLPRDEIESWYDANNELSTFYADISAFYVGAYERSHPGIGGCGLHDPLAIGVVIDPTLVQTENMSITVDTDDLVGRTKEIIGEKSVNVCLKVDVDKFLKNFLDTLNFSPTKS